MKKKKHLPLTCFVRHGYCPPHSRTSNVFVNVALPIVYTDFRESRAQIASANVLSVYDSFWAKWIDPNTTRMGDTTRDCSSIRRGFDTHLFFPRKFDKRRRARHRELRQRKTTTNTRDLTRDRYSHGFILRHGRYHSRWCGTTADAPNDGDARATVIRRRSRMHRRTVVLTSKHRCQSWRRGLVAAEKNGKRNARTLVVRRRVIFIPRRIINRSESRSSSTVGSVISRADRYCSMTLLGESSGKDVVTCCLCVECRDIHCRDPSALPTSIRSFPPYIII